MLLSVLVMFFFWDVVVHRLNPILVLALQGYNFAQAFLGIGLASAGLWLCTGFQQSLSSLCWVQLFLQASPVLFLLFWAVLMHRLPPVFVLPLMGCCFTQVCFLPSVSNTYSLENIKLVANLTTRALCDTVV